MSTPRPAFNRTMDQLGHLSVLPGRTHYVDGGTGTDLGPGNSWSAPKASIQAAVNAAEPGDRIIVRYVDGGYDETVTIPASKPGLTIEGGGPLGSVYIEPSTAGAEGMLVLADDTTLINIGVAGDDTADYGIQVGSQTVSPDRFRAYRCKFELAGGAGAAAILKGAGDVRLEDCEFAWAGSGLLFAANDDGFCTQVNIVRPRFHNLTTVHVGNAAAGGVTNLTLLDGIHDNAEDGTAPTDYLKVDRAEDTGFVSGCRFATATNDAAVLTIAAGIMWAANMTEAGWSAARPA